MEKTKKNKRTEVSEIDLPAIISFKKAQQNFITMSLDECVNYAILHNPNLAVVCDAEQIIKMNIDKKNNNIVSYQSGSIENPEINKCIVDVLEGTYPAFHNRDQKYINKK